MKQPIMDIDVRGMQVEINSYKPGNGLAWSTLFPLKYTPTFDLKGLEANEGIPVSADRVAFNTKAPLKSRRFIGSWSGKLDKIAISKAKNELEINDYEDLKVKAANNTEDAATARYLVDLVYDDLKACNDGMDYKIECDALRIGSSGVHSYPAEIEGNNATEDIINFNVPQENFGGAAVVWSDAENANGLKDLATWQSKIAKKGLRKPMFAIMEKTAYDLLCAQKATAFALYPQVSNLSLITSDMITLETINARQRRLGYPQIVVIDSYVTIERKNGDLETIKPWNENAVVLAPTTQLGWTYYKPVPMVRDTDAYQVQGSYYKMTRYSELNPMQEVTMAEAYVQPALINRASLVFINITKTNWNGGK